MLVADSALKDILADHTLNGCTSPACDPDNNLSAFGGHLVELIQDFYANDRETP